MIVVTTPTGKIGSQVIPHVLAADENVRVVARDPSKLSPGLRNKLEIVTGSLDDDAVMEDALKNAESVFLAVPPSLTDNNDEAYYLRFTRPLLKAMKGNGALTAAVEFPIPHWFASKAMQHCPVARRSRMMPEPTTAATRNAVSRNSETARARRSNFIDCQSGRFLS